MCGVIGALFEKTTNDIPNGRRSTSGHQYPTGGCRVPDKKHKYKDYDDAREEYNDAEGNGYARVASQPQGSPKEGEARAETIIRSHRGRR